MKIENSVDILEDNIVSYDKEILKILLKDRTTNSNIIWATNDYNNFGCHYSASSEIRIELITGYNSNIIQPRITKTQNQQSSRTREKAEVFTPSWICNEQNNLVDEAWFGKPNTFNIPKEKSWIANPKSVEFENIKGKAWADYIDANRLEISCGEAPYIVSRYDTVTGETIEIENRIGFLDRKLRIVNENTNDENEWFKWAERAYQSTYGYEYQGDNLLIARENLLYTFIDNKLYKFNSSPTLEELKKVATIISWNIWQMDGIKNTTPLGAIPEETLQMTLFEVETEEPEASFCKIKDWRSKKIIEFKSLLKG